LLTKIRKAWENDTSQVLLAVLIDGTKAWLKDEAFPAERHPPGVQDLITEQGKIGWEQIFYGRFSKLWDRYQRKYLLENSIKETKVNNGPQWLSRVMTVIWREVHEEWTKRNKIRHGMDEETKKQQKSAQTEWRIRYWWKKKELVKEEQVLKEVFRWRDADEHLAKMDDVKSREYWLSMNEPTIDASIIRTMKERSRVETYRRESRAQRVTLRRPAKE
jgi:hypothetical protein